jgi:hypothetical protein
VVGVMIIVPLIVGTVWVLANRDRPPSVNSRSQPAWGCPPESRGMSVVDGPPTGGSPTQVAAAASFAGFLAQDGTGSAQALRAAFGSTTGPSRYEPATGLLFVDAKIRAKFGIGQLSDGTFAVGSLEHCMRPPSEGDSPGPTPSPSEQSTS